LMQWNKNGEVFVQIFGEASAMHGFRYDKRSVLCSHGVLQNVI
jgi:hypothetical protein